MVCHFPDCPRAAGDGCAYPLVNFDDNGADFHRVRLPLPLARRFGHADNIGIASANVNMRLAYKNKNSLLALFYWVFVRLLSWRPYRESNPGYLREREVS